MGVQALQYFGDRQRIAPQLDQRLQGRVVVVARPVRREPRILREVGPAHRLGQLCELPRVQHCDRVVAVGGAEHTEGRTERVAVPDPCRRPVAVQMLGKPGGHQVEQAVVHRHVDELALARIAARDQRRQRGP